ncbi:MAG: hypothetical protein Q7R94_01015, partial [bacterium]|nr:hypothetical protein [bacterium]
GSWTNTTALPTALTTHSSAVSGDYVYVIGGAPPALPPTSTVRYAQINTSTGALGSWTNTTALSTGLRWHSSNVSGGYVYVIGDNAGGTTSTVRYALINANGTLGSWTNTTALPTALTTHSSAVSGDYVYVIGGGFVGVTSTVLYFTP